MCFYHSPAQVATINRPSEVVVTLHAQHLPRQVSGNVKLVRRLERCALFSGMVNMKVRRPARHVRL